MNRRRYITAAAALSFALLLGGFYFVGSLRTTAPKPSFGGTGAFVQDATTTVSAATITATMTSVPTLNNLLVVCAWGNQNTTATMPAYWTQMYLKASGNSTTAEIVTAFYRIATSSESKIATVTWGTSTGSSIMFIEYSGIDTVNPLNMQGGINNASGAGSYKSPSVTATTTANGAVLTACMGQRGSATTFTKMSFNSSVTGVTTRWNSPSSANSFVYWDAFVSSASGAYEAEASTTVNAVNAAGIHLFSQSGGAVVTSDFVQPPQLPQLWVMN